MLLERRLYTTINRNISTSPTKSHKYHLLIKAQKPEVDEEETDAGELPDAILTAPKLIEIESDCGTDPVTLVVATACFIVCSAINPLLPSKVTVFALPGDKDPTLIPDTISPETGTPLICKLPNEVISFGIFAATLTFST